LLDKSVLIFRIGSLGDTLVAVPAMWAVREHFRGARVTLLCDYHPGKGYVLGSDLLAGSGIVDDFLHYPVDASRMGRLLKPIRAARLAARLRWERFDTLVYLPPSVRSRAQAERDRAFFRAGGIRQFIGMDVDLSGSTAPAPGSELPRETDQILLRLAPQIPIPPRGQGRMELGLTEQDERGVASWLSDLPPDGGRVWIGIGPGSKMPAKIWPRERFLEVLRELAGRFDVWPVVFGGSEDRTVGNWLVRELGRGYVAAGNLGLRASASALSRCQLYLGNDTGTMHMAAAVGVRCVAIFSARSYPGTWYPYGPGHQIFRTQIDCENCGLVECIDRKMECILRIGTDEVLAACAGILCEA
jgi:ADP-heptose:LPS heptosyltransferase